MYILLAILMFGFLIFIHELGHFLSAKLLDVQVNEFAICMGPVLWQKKKGETTYSLRAIPIGGFCAMEGEDEEADNPRAFPQKSWWRRLIILAAGSFMNFVAGFLVIVLLYTGASGYSAPIVTDFFEGCPLESSDGLQAGDEIVAVNGRRCFVANDILYELVRTEAYRADFTVKRDGQKVELPDVQFDTWQDENGETHMTLGFSVYGIEKTPLSVLKEAWNSTLYYGRIVFTSLADLLRGRESINDLSGPVGIVTAIGQAASYGWEDVAELLALITINLGVLNLLPFPALDGGKIVFLLIEAVTGHAVPEKIQSSLTVAAFALLFGLMLFATYNDIVRLVTGSI